MAEIAFEEVTEKGDLEEICKFLQGHLPHSYKHYLLLTFYLKATCLPVSEFNYRFFVSKDKETFVFLTSQGVKAPTCVIFSTSEEIPRMPFLDWNEKFYLMVYKPELMTKADNIATVEGGTICWLPVHYLYIYLDASETSPRYPVPNGIRLAPLLPEHAQLVTDSWPHHDATTNPFIESLIRKGVSRAVYLDSTPVSWILLISDGSVGMLYTCPEHRGKGFATLLLQDIKSEIKKDGLNPYAHVISNAVGSVKAFNSAEFTNICDLFWGIFIPS